MWIVVLHRIRRAIASVSGLLLLVGPALIAALVAAWARGSAIDGIPIPNWLLIGVAVGIGLLIYQARFEYKRRTNDLTWALGFKEEFSSDQMKLARSRAATVLKEKMGQLRHIGEELADIDDVLDFLEHVGFCHHGDQITPEVAHQIFHDYVRGYYLASRDYIETWQQIEPTRWEYIKELFDATNAIDRRRSRALGLRTLDHTQILLFLDSEIQLANTRRRSNRSAIPPIKVGPVAL